MVSPDAPGPDVSRPLQHHNLQVIDQALALVAAFRAPGAPAFAGTVGAHLRHVIEHFDALLTPAVAGEVAYDDRRRDRALEQCPNLAHARLTAVRDVLWQTALPAINAPLRVHGVGGSGGELAFCVESTFGRELAFVASHAVHHFALIQRHCLEQGIDLAGDFGKAPATVAFERACAASPHSSSEDSPCNTLQAAA